MKIYCCGCKKDIKATLTSGKEVYPRRYDLHYLPFWKCDKCTLYVGCHHKTKERTKPLGCIPTKEIKNARQHIHKILDPLWQCDNKKQSKKARTKIYLMISDHLGYEYHTAETRSIEECRKVYRIIQKIKREMSGLVFDKEVRVG